MRQTTVTIYTDGACFPNPGNGAWGAVLITENGHTRTICGRVADTTNNRMELQAVIEALRALKWACHVTVYSDSQYIVNTIEMGWNRNANIDLWAQLDEAAQRHAITWRWVRGHDGNEYNEAAHDAANFALKGGVCDG